MVREIKTGEGRTEYAPVSVTRPGFTRETPATIFDARLGSQSGRRESKYMLTASERRVEKHALVVTPPHGSR